MSTLSNQQLPTSAIAGGAMTVQIARAMLGLIGVGYQAPQSSLNAADFLALATSYGDARAAILNVWNQEFVASATGATGLLSAWERTLGLHVDTTMTDAARQTRLVAFVRSAIAGTPQAIESAVAAITGTCTVEEFTAADVYVTDPTPTAATRRGVFRFVVVVPWAFAVSGPSRDLIASIVERMKPAHTSFTISSELAVQYDKPTSGYDVTALGA